MTRMSATIEPGASGTEQVLDVAAPEETPPAAAKPVCPKLQEGVTAWPFFTYADPAKTLYVIGSRKVDRYITVPAAKLPVILKVLERLDGEHSLESIEQRFLEKERRRVDVTALYRRLSENGLIATPAPAKIAKGDIEAMSVRLFTLNIEKVFIALSRFKLLVSFVVAAVFFLIAAGTAMAILQRETLAPSVNNLLRNSFQASSLLYPLLLLLSFLLHEMAHGIAGARYSLIATRLEVALYLGFIPIVYLRIPGIYTLPPGQRIKVWSAGICWNLALASLCVCCSIWFPASPQRDLWLMVGLANIFIALTNLFPFLPTDGYFILSTLFKRHNVRRNAWMEFTNWIRAREHNFRGASLFYFVSTVAVVGFILWKDMAWLGRVRHSGTRLQFLILALLISLSALLLGWRLLFRKLRSAGKTSTSKEVVQDRS